MLVLQHGGCLAWLWELSGNEDENVETGNRLGKTWNVTLRNVDFIWKAKPTTARLAGQFFFPWGVPWLSPSLRLSLCSKDASSAQHLYPALLYPLPALFSSECLLIPDIIFSCYFCLSFISLLCWQAGPMRPRHSGNVHWYIPSTHHGACTQEALNKHCGMHKDFKQRSNVARGFLGQSL